MIQAHIHTKETEECVEIHVTALVRAIVKIDYEEATDRGMEHAVEFAKKEFQKLLGSGCKFHKFEQKIHEV